MNPYEYRLSNTISGCKADRDCFRKDECYRYVKHKTQDTAFVGFSANHLCTTENYTYFLPNKEYDDDLDYTNEEEEEELEIANLSPELAVNHI